jgi:K+-transporting ATPase KdpF subunit
VSALEVVALLLVVGLAAYLVAALLYPEHFQ